MEQGIFDIQSFSLHDGPGIRTTVFMKGCPLRCQWCSNPEGIDASPTLSYQKNICSSCLSCVEVCPRDALTSDGGDLVVKHDRCTACALCLKVCPTGALKLYGYRESAVDLIKRIKKDQAFFEKSGGGLTLSGGEVMFQADYAIEILRLSKAEHIHTCIETCGFASQEDYARVLPFVDLFLFDYKITDSQKHREFTGVSNKLILENLGFLSEQGAHIVLRVPIIPGMNDTEGHFRAIAQISQQYDGIQRVEILPYHNWGAHKYEEIGWQKPDLNLESVSYELAQNWEEELKTYGAKNVVIS